MTHFWLFYFLKLISRPYSQRCHRKYEITAKMYFNPHQMYTFSLLWLSLQHHPLLMAHFFADFLPHELPFPHPPCSEQYDHFAALTRQWKPPLQYCLSKQYSHGLLSLERTSNLCFAFNSSEPRISSWKIVNIKDCLICG